MVYYCRYWSPSVEFNDVNLQLFALRKAAENWNDLVSSIGKQGKADQEKEKLVFVLSCLGLSLSQLLGQNNPFFGEYIPEPRKLLSNIMSEKKIDLTERDKFNDSFQEFIKNYDAIRHFGKNEDDQKYKIIDELTINKLKKFVLLTVRIWDLVCELHDTDNVDRSICDFIPFDDLS